MAKTMISSADLGWIFTEKLKEFEDCPPGTAIAIVPDALSGWSAVVSNKSRTGHPLCAGRIEDLEKKLREIYSLAKD